MSDDLDDRIAYLRQQRQLEGAEQTQKAADLIQAIDELQGSVRETAFKAITVQGQMQVLEAQLDELDRRVQRTSRYLAGAIAASVLLCLVIVLVTVWSSSNLKAARIETESRQSLFTD
jgi:TolA-binding protein